LGRPERYNDDNANGPLQTSANVVKRSFRTTRLWPLVAAVVAVLLLAPPLAAEAQQPGKLYRIGILGSSPTSATPTWEAFRQGLRDLGYIEGQNITIQYRGGKYQRLPDLAAELVRLKVDVIVTGGTPGALAAKQATNTIPIVMAVVSDPVGSGIVPSLARPGGNITGLSLMAPEMSAKQLEVLKEIVPRVTRVAVLSNPANPGVPLLLREIRVAAEAKGLQLQLFEMRDPSELGTAFSAFTSNHASALLVLSDPMFFAQRERIADLALKNRLPTVFEDRGSVEAGGLMAYGANYSALARRAATYVDKILKGTKPADLPIEQPTRLELFINLKTAKALGLTIPRLLLQRADQIID
jgi:putative ABC transport system substrate-binding protein